MIINRLKRELLEVTNMKRIIPFRGITQKYTDRKIILPNKDSFSKLLPTLKEAIRQVGLKDGMTISFHHHLRNGEYSLIRV